VATVALLSLLVGSVTGLVVGRWQPLLLLAAAIAAAALLAVPEAGALGALTAAAFLAGMHLHRLVAESQATR
jgi:hypothetical protein